MTGEGQGGGMPNEIDLRDYIDVLIRRWKFILAMPALALIAAALATFAVPATYQAVATLALSPATVSVSTSNLLPPYYLMVDSPRNLPAAHTPAYYVAVLNSAEVVNAAQSFGLAQERALITVAADGGDRALIHITARGADPQSVADAANAYAQAGAQHIQRLLAPTGDDARIAKQTLDTAQNALEKFLLDHQITEYDPALPPVLTPAKRKELEQLSRERDLAESVYLDFAREFAKSAILAETAYRPAIIAAPVPRAPVAPQLVQNLLLGAAFGLLVGMLGALTLEIVRRSQ